MARQPRQALVIYNPHSGTSGDLDRRLGAIVRRLGEDSQYVVNVRPWHPNLTSAELMSPILGPFELVIAVGGDGTIRTVLGAVAESGSRAKVAIVPFGTGNLLARALGIIPSGFPGDILERALDIIVQGTTATIDLGRLNNHWFVIDAGLGPISDAIIVPRQEAKRSWRLLAYVWPLLKSISRSPLTFSLSIDGSEQITVSASGLFISNTSEMGIGRSMDLDQVRDGLLDLTIMSPTSIKDYWAITWRFGLWFLLGKAQGGPPYLIRKVKSLDIDVIQAQIRQSPVHRLARRLRAWWRGKPDLARPIHQKAIAMVDGDRCDSTPVHIEVVPQAVTIIVPPPARTLPTERTMIKHAP